MLKIGPYNLDTRVALAPMAGVTDRPFRQLCRELGAGLVFSEMVTSDPSLWHTKKSSYRLNHQGEAEPRAVQIAGGDPEMMATAARLNAERGAQIIDINMGCPAKKVCNKAAGSALLKDEALVEEILHAVVDAVDLPVTLKIRTGWSPETDSRQMIDNASDQSRLTRMQTDEPAPLHSRHHALFFSPQIPLICHEKVSCERIFINCSGSLAIMT